MKTHVYKLVLGILLTLFTFSINAQDYEYIPIVKPGLQVWTAIYIEDGHKHFNRFALTEQDTLIEGVTYKKLYWFQNSVFNPLNAECIGGLRENAQKQVFYKGKVDNNGEDWFNIMFYDFSLLEGEKMNSISDGLKFKVSKIDTIEVAGTLRKKFSIVGSVEGSADTYVIGTWIEGIGNEKGLLYDMLRMLTGYKYSYLKCYEHNGVLEYLAEGDDDCDNPYVGLEDISLENNSITLYPNPTNSEINIESENIINSIDIFNSFGQKVYMETINSKEKSIGVSYLNNGVYVIVLNTDNGLIHKKIIKN